MARSSPKPPPALGLVLVRAAVGTVLVAHGWRWVTAGGAGGAEVRIAVRAALAELSGALAWWGESVLLSNPDGVAFLWRWTALLAGVLLLLGALTRPAGAVVFAFALHGAVYGPEGQRLALALVAVSALSSALSGAGRRLGLDAVFDQHFSPWVTWTRRGFTARP